MLTFTDIFKKYQINQIDLLQIDTEGYDGELIKLFPFDLFKPSIIHFESKHLNKEELEIVLEHLLSNGYFIARDKAEDMIAINYRN